MIEEGKPVHNGDPEVVRHQVPVVKIKLPCGLHTYEASHRTGDRRVECPCRAWLVRTVVVPTRYIVEEAE